jgi:hypothetical protein
MTNQSWLDQVRRQLAENNLPPAYIRRFMDELSDHCQDITEDAVNAKSDPLSRLGEPNQVAEAAICSFRQRTFLGRHPSATFLVFGVTPPASLLGLFVLAFACLYGVFSTCEWLGIELSGMKRFDPAASVVLPYILSLLMVIIPASLASLFYCKLIARLGIGKRWIILSCVVLAIAAMLPIWTIVLSDRPGQSALRCGVGSPQNLADAMLRYVGSFRQWLQFLPPLLIGLWFLRPTHTQGRTETSLRQAA